MKRKKVWATLLVMVGLSVPLSGCGKSASELEGIFPAHGSVIVDGEPAEYANVVLIPADPDSGLPRAYGVVEEDGEFRLSTKRQFDGAQPGEYLVTISWAKPKNPHVSEPDYGPELLPAKYQDPVQSGLKVVIEATSNDLEPFLLKK